MSESATAAASPWYRALDRTQWKALIASNLGWTFDGFEVFALILTVGVALRQLLDPSQYQFIPAYAGAIIAITVFGWGLGGLLGGILADYLGRKRSMTLTILAYSLLTGLSAFAWDWLSFAVLRFLVGLAIGSEWATGSSIMAELWPAKARGRGGAFLQAGYPIGSILASGVWLLIGSSDPGAWRYMFLIGVLPALLVFWIRRNIPESPRWEESDRRRRAAYDLRRQGAALEGENAALVRFTLVDMFAEPAVRMRLFLTFVMSLSVTIGYWGVSTFVPDRLCVLRLPRRSLRAQADDHTLLCDVPDPHSARLSGGQEHRSPGARVRGLRIFHPGLLRVDADLAAGALPHAHARHRCRLHLQRAAPDLRNRTADRRHHHRRAGRLRQGGNHHRHVLHPRAPRRAVPAGDAWQAAAGERHAGGGGRRRAHAADGVRSLVRRFVFRLGADFRLGANDLAKPSSAWSPLD